MSDVADVYARLRVETAKMLGLDISALSAADEVKVGKVAGLRLELDRLQSAQMRGEPIDPKQLVSISELLESALRPAEVVATNGGSRAEEAREKLAELLHGAAMAKEFEREQKIAEAMIREEQVMAAEAFNGMPVPVPHVEAMPTATDGTVVPLRAKKAEPQNPSWMNAVPHIVEGPGRTRWDPGYGY